MTEIEKARPLTPAEVSWKTAQRVAGTPFVPSAFRGKPEAVFAAILFGEELGIGPMQSLNSIHVIEGKPGMSPELMRALVARAGHRIDVKEASGERVTLWGKRCDNDSEATVTWTMDDAKLAGLAGRGAWKTYPRAMLLARATSELCRMVFADVVAGLSYTPEEITSVSGHDWEETPVDPLSLDVVSKSSKTADDEPGEPHAPRTTPDPAPELSLPEIREPELVDIADIFPDDIVDAEIVDPEERDSTVISLKQIGKIRGLMTEWGLNKSEQISLVCIILGIEITHISKLSKTDGSKVIDYLVKEHPGGVV